MLEEEKTEEDTFPWLVFQQIADWLRSRRSRKSFRCAGHLNLNGNGIVLDILAKQQF